MKIFKTVGMAIVGGLLLASCANPVYVQTDESVNLAKYKTYAFVKTRANQDDLKDASAFAEQNIKLAARNALKDQGWVETTERPDVLISYDLMVERAVERQSDPVYSQPFNRVYYNPYWRRWGTVYYPSQFVGYDSYDVPVREGTITLTMIDADTDKTIWQGWTTDRLNNRKFSNEEVEKNVKNIFKKFNTDK